MSFDLPQPPETDDIKMLKLWCMQLWLWMQQFGEILLEKTAVGKRPVRLLGISLSQLTDIGSGRQLSLFDRHHSNQKRKDLNKTLDSIYEKFGDKGIRPGALVDE